MSAGSAKRLTLAVDETRRVSALLQLPPAARTGRKDAEVRAEMLDALATWIEQAVHRS